MKNIKLTESCGYGSVNSEVSIDDHTADFLIRTGRGHDIRGTEQTADGLTVKGIGTSEEYLNEVNTETGGTADTASGATVRPGREAKKANQEGAV